MIMVEFNGPHNNSRPGPSGHYSHQPHRGSPHLQHLEHPSTHSTPSPPYNYAQLPHLAQQQPQPVRSTPTSYPSPASYPSPSVSAYQFSAQTAPPHPPRGSPYSQPAAINLPPIRLNPPPPHPTHEGSPLLGSPLPLPPQQPIHGYFPQALPPPSIHPGQITSSPNHHQPLRYALPSVPNPERIMSGGRHKKEIKRRTKTGCLTCRKRRIKCDEGHPTCKNCQKSKRDCLGYDPIFKAQPGPAAIQPAPSGVGGPSYAHTTSTAGSSPTSSCDTYDYPQIDPALDATSHPHMSTPSMLDTHTTYRPELKRTIDRTSPFSSASDTTRTPYTPIPRSATPGGLSRHHDLQGGNTAKRIKIDDLLSVGSLSGASAQPLSPPSSELAATIAANSVESVKNIYKARYAPAVDEFLETEWFKDRGVRKMCSDSQLAEVMAEIFERLKARGGSYAEEEDPSIRRSGQDSDILWAAIKMCYGTKIPASDNRREESSSGSENRDDEGVEALRRINIVECLVTGGSLEEAVSSPTENSTDHNWSNDANRFWMLLGRLVSLKRDGQAARAESSHLLNECHNLVGSKESRKLLYSIAEVRFLLFDPKKPLTQQPYHPHRAHIETIARAHTSISSLDRRIAGRAMGLWGIALTDAPFCMPAV